jgi:hypothetical protein
MDAYDVKGPESYSMSRTGSGMAGGDRGRLRPSENEAGKSGESSWALETVEDKSGSF